MDAQLESREQMQGLMTLLKESMREARYDEAFPIFTDAQRAYYAYTQGLKPNCGSIESNTVDYLFSNIISLVSASISHQVSARRTILANGCAGPHLLTRDDGGDDVSLALRLALRLSLRPVLPQGFGFSRPHRHAATNMQPVAGLGIPKKVFERMRTLYPELCAKLAYDAGEHYADAPRWPGLARPGPLGRRPDAVAVGALGPAPYDVEGSVPAAC